MTKVQRVKVLNKVLFPVVLYGCVSWSIKKAEHQRINAFDLWCWRRLLRDSWTARRSSQSILKEINPEYSLEGLMLKLNLQYVGQLLQRADSLKKTLMLVKTEQKRRRANRGWDGWIASLTQWTWVWTNSGREWRTGKPAVLQAMGSQRVRHNLATEYHYYFIITKCYNYCTPLNEVQRDYFCLEKLGKLSQSAFSSGFKKWWSLLK